MSIAVAIVGALVGANDGWPLGASVGGIVKSGVGASDGDSDGWPEGGSVSPFSEYATASARESVGSRVGKIVGESDWNHVGESVGLRDERNDGKSVGVDDANGNSPFRDGAPVNVGCSVGTRDGCRLGRNVECFDGCSVGVSDGTHVGLTTKFVGAKDGFTVGLNGLNASGLVGASVGTAERAVISAISLRVYSGVIVGYLDGCNVPLIVGKSVGVSVTHVGHGVGLMWLVG